MKIVGVTTIENRRTLPVSTPWLSETLSTHVPFGSSPSNADNGLLGA